MPRPQFTISSLLVAMLVVAAFFGGIAFEQRQKQPDSTASPVTTVYVRLVEATNLPHGKAERLLDAVRLQIELTTPFKVVASKSEADSELLCTVSVTDNAQQIKVEWVDRHGAKLKPPVSIPLDDLSAGE